MRQIVLYITASLDGFIADVGGGVEWLHHAEGEDYGYGDLMDSIDAVLQGSHTYLDVLDMVDEDPYEGKANYVFTSRDDLPVMGKPIFVHENPVKFVRKLKEQPGGRIWLIGGGELASTLVSAGLVDEIDLAVQPVVLGDGVPLWNPPIDTRQLELLDAEVMPAGLARLHYRVLPS